MSEQHAARQVVIQAIGRTVVVVGLGSDIHLFILSQRLFVRVVTTLRREPVVPLAGVVHLVGEDVACLVTHTVRGTEDVPVVGIILVGILYGFAFGVGVGMRGTCQIRVLIFSQDVGAGLVILAVDVTSDAVHVGVLYEELLLRSTQQVPVPVADGVVLVIFLVVDDHLLSVAELHAGSGIVGIAVGHDVQQLHLAVGCGGDGQRNVHRLAEGIGHAGVGRYILVIDIRGTLDVPVVGRHLVFTHIFVADVVAIVDNGLCAVDEVAGGLECQLIGVVLRCAVVIVPLGDGVFIQLCQRCVLADNLGAHAVLVLGIDETAADAC